LWQKKKQMYKYEQTRTSLSEKEIFSKFKIYIKHSMDFSIYILCIMWEILLLKNVLGVQISSVHFPKDGSSCYEWFIVTADFGGFREIKHLLIIFSLYRFELYKNLDFYCVWNVEFCINQAAFAGGFDFLL